MTPTPSPQPTLWRTCRAIANRTRLRIFGLLAQQPGQTVSAVVARLQQPLSVASESLRALEARGLLTARRVGRQVEYRPSPAPSGSRARGLVAAMQSAFHRESQPAETLFKLATTFTHPRRIAIFRALQTAPQTLGQIRAATRISGRALHRHLRKLEARGFVRHQLGIYSVVKRSDEFGRELARLAAE